ncbi:MAG: signal peptidase I [Verrucomicrobiae bacterium]|nr:signal peptidase I [Verrucomicrobiae bacterium]
MISRILAWRKARKERRALAEMIAHCHKQVRRRSDRLAPKAADAFQREIQKARNALHSRATDLPAAAEALVAAHQRCFPAEKPSALRENVEVILVALVVAMGVRAYFLQPFKIPTGSMQPTLNGITVRPVSDRERAWGYRAIAFPVFGERILRYTAEADGRIEWARDVKLGPFHYGGVRGFLSFLPMDATEFSVGGVRYWFPAERRKFEADVLQPLGDAKPLLEPGREYRRGEVLLECVVQSGDQLFVDRLNYHFRKPRRADVFVFETHDIPVGMPGDFYIKRLAGLPGDTLEIRDPRLWVNGHPATEPAFERVASCRDGYRGYTSHAYSQQFLKGPMDAKTLGTREYFALGDNSFASADSRMWGVVPYANIIGRGWFVYWPFTRHFGRVR